MPAIVVKKIKQQILKNKLYVIIYLKYYNCPKNIESTNKCQKNDQSHELCLEQLAYS